MRIEDYYFHLEEASVIDKEELKIKIASLKKHSITISRFKNITLRRYRINYSKIKDYFFKWRDKAMKFKIQFLKFKKALKAVDLSKTQCFSKSDVNLTFNKD